MYILKNAWKNITRSKTRNILIGIIVLVIAISSCIALSIKNSAIELINSYKNSYQVEATLSLQRKSMQRDRNSQGEDRKSIKDFMANISEIDVETAKKYADSEYVKSYVYKVNTSLNSTTAEKVTAEESSDENTNMMMPGMGRGDMQFSGQNSKSKVTGDFDIVGYNSLDAMSEFINSDCKISSGAVFGFNVLNNECLISDELAEENSLKVGDSITFVNPNNETETYDLKITGIYSDTTETEEFSMFSNSANKVLTNYETINKIVENSKSNEDSALKLRTNVTFILKSESVVDRFEAELKEKGLNEYYEVNTNLDTLESNIKPIQNLSSFATTCLVLVLSIGGIILLVLNMINIRERRYEIGVLRCIGMKKYKVMEQFLIETFIVTFVAIIIGTVAGSMLSVPVANNMLKSEISSMQEEQDEVSQNFGMGPGNGQGMPEMGNKDDIRNKFSNKDTNYVDKINAVIDIKTVLELVVIGLSLTVLSSTIAMISISRYSPLKILSNRS